MPCKRASLSIGGPVGEPGGGSFVGTFERQEEYIWVPLWTPRLLRFQIWETSGTLVEEQGSIE